jgi:hypothetical protein
MGKSSLFVSMVVAISLVPTAADFVRQRCLAKPEYRPSPRQESVVS